MESGGSLTIIMIAHRLQTIATAQNLIYLESPKKIISAEKGTPEYDKIFEKLQSETYAHQQEDLGIGYTSAKKMIENEELLDPSPIGEEGELDIKNTLMSPEDLDGKLADMKK